MFYYFDTTEWIFLLPAVIISVWAQAKVSWAFRKYSKIESARKITGREVAQRVLIENNISPIPVMQVDGYMSDHYHPVKNQIFLSKGVYDSSSITAVCVAAHEAGHAVQRATGYKPMKVRNSLVNVANIGSNLGIMLLLFAFLIPSLSKIGIALFSLSTLFTIVTLPVEFNASRRAIKTLKEAHILEDDELYGAKKVLKAAAMTYVAAMLSSLLNLLRYVAIFSRDSRD